MKSPTEKSMRTVYLAAVVIVVLAVSQVSGAGMYITVPRGTIHMAYVDYNDSNTVTVTAGYGECNGNYWEVISPTDHDMTSLAAGEDFHYIYVSDANSVYPDPNFYDSTTEPVWSDSKLGWYNGNDRCIGVVWSPSGSATLMQFTINSDLKWVCVVQGESIKEVLTNGNPNGAFQTVESTAYIPVNAKTVRVKATNRDMDALAYVSIATFEASECQLQVSSYGNAYAITRGWLALERGASRDLKWFGENDDDNNFDVLIQGFQIER